MPGTVKQKASPRYLQKTNVGFVGEKKDTPQKAALREIMGNYLKENNVKVKDGTDVNSIMRDMMSIILEGVLDQEMGEELGYSKYDYRNKDTDNSRNGHSQKTMHTNYGDMEFLDYSELLNALDSGASAKITLNNRRVNKKEFEVSLLIPMKEVGLDEYRGEYMEVIAQRMRCGFRRNRQRRMAGRDTGIRSMYRTFSGIIRVGAYLLVYSGMTSL